jgi:hypothetical protein
MTNLNPSTTEQLNKLIEFRQAVYTPGLGCYRDTQMELSEGLRDRQPVHLFAEITLSSLFQRCWPSANAALEAGHQDTV